MEKVTETNQVTHLDESAMLTPAEAGDFLGVKKATLSQWRYNGRSPRFYKLGGTGRSCRVRYRRSDLLAWIESQAVCGGVVEGGR